MTSSASFVECCRPAPALVSAERVSSFFGHGGGLSHSFFLQMAACLKTGWLADSEKKRVCLLLSFQVCFFVRSGWWLGCFEDSNWETAQPPSDQLEGS